MFNVRLLSSAFGSHRPSARIGLRLASSFKARAVRHGSCGGLNSARRIIVMLTSCSMLLQSAVPFALAEPSGSGAPSTSVRGKVVKPLEVHDDPSWHTIHYTPGTRNWAMEKVKEPRDDFVLSWLPLVWKSHRF